jgi:hypothetical protein
VQYFMVVMTAPRSAGPTVKTSAGLFVAAGGPEAVEVEDAAALPVAAHLGQGVGSFAGHRARLGSPAGPLPGIGSRTATSSSQITVRASSSSPTRSGRM